MGLDSLMYQSNWQVSFECNSERLSLFTSQVVKWYLIQYTELELCHHLASKLDKTEALLYSRSLTSAEWNKTL